MKLLIMHSRSAFVVAVTLGLVINTTYSHLSRRSNANGDVFNVLLGLYKLNPLKSSHLYKTFSKQLLLTRSDQNSVPNRFDSIEEGKEDMATNLHEIEKMIHVKNKSPRRYQKPEYDIDDADSIENFTVDVIVKDRFTTEAFYMKHLKENDSDGDISAILGHIGSNEIDSEIPATKLLPVKDNIIKQMQPKNHNDAIFEFLDRRNKPVGAVVDVRNDLQGVGSVLDKKLDTMGDVIVL